MIAAERRAYRQDIDSLRAIAVMAVMLTHLVPPLLPGGFVGVDMFFVISGYVIFRGLVKDTVAQRLSIRKFYWRRVRRLLPQLLAVCCFVGLAGVIILLPSDLVRLPGRTLASLTGLSNFLFASQAGYFMPASQWNPLLHTWTLALEFQFYLIAPLVVMALAKRGPTAIAWALGIIWLAAAAYTFRPLREPPSLHYMGTFEHVWQFLTGAGIAMYPLQRFRPLWANIIAAGAFAAMVGGFFLISRDQAYPDFRALVPTMATATMIVVLPSATIAHRMMSLPAMSFVGQMSYSLYIWHWPVIVFAEYLFPTQSYPITSFCIVMVVTFGLSLCAYMLVEQPLRSPARVSDKAFIRTMAIAAVSLAALMLTIRTSGGFSGRFSNKINTLDSASGLLSPWRDSCHLGVPTETLPPPCRYGAQVEPSIAVWSDSHGVELIAAMREALSDRGLSAEQFTYSNCPPGNPQRIETACDRHNGQVLQVLLASRNIHTVVLAAAFDNPQFLTAGGQWFEEYDEAARTLSASGKRLVIVYPVPRQPFHVPRTMIDIMRFGWDQGWAKVRVQDYESRTFLAFAALDAIKGPNIARIYPHKLLCEDGTCEYERSRHPLYYDDNHLSLAGAQPIAQAVIAAMDKCR